MVCKVCTNTTTYMQCAACIIPDQCVLCCWYIDMMIHKHHRTWRWISVVNWKVPFEEVLPFCMPISHSKCSYPKRWPSKTFDDLSERCVIAMSCCEMVRIDSALRLLSHTLKHPKTVFSMQITTCFLYALFPPLLYDWRIAEFSFLPSTSGFT